MMPADHYTSRSVIPVYQDHATDFDRIRDRSLTERHWLNRFAENFGSDSTILDLGCGSGEPIARHLLDSGFSVTGVDAAEAMIDLSRNRFPLATWICADMRGLRLDRVFHGLIAWDSFFHLEPADQRSMFGVFAAHARPGTRLMFTTGPLAGEVWGTMFDEPLYHASLDPAEYRSLLAESGFSRVAFRAEDPDCGGRTIWLAAYEQRG